MARPPDPARKPQLLAEIVEFLLDKPLSSLTFRSVATALDVSTYTLVYHFGSRAELIREVVLAVSSRAAVMEERLAQSGTDLQTYFARMADGWAWSLEPRNRQLQRLELEAGLLEVMQPDRHNQARTIFETWRRIATTALVRLGVDSPTAVVEGRMLMDTFRGIQYDLLLTDDVEGATAAFELAVSAHRRRLDELLGGRATGAPVEESTGDPSR